MKNTMMKKIIFFCLFAVLVLNLSAQQRGNVNYEKNKGNVNYSSNSYTAPTNLPTAVWTDHNTVILEVNALSNQKANSYIAIFSITQLGKTAEEADRLVNQRFDAFASALVSLGIKREDIFLDLVSFVPVYEFEEEKRLFSKMTYNEIPKGFEVQQNVHIKYTDSRLMSKIMTAAARNEIYDIVKVDYIVDNVEEVYHDLRKRAVAFLIKEIHQMEELGVDLDASFRIAAEEERAAYPIDRYSSYRAFSSPSLDGTSKGRVTSADKAVTAFYDKVKYDEFEIIVNPAMLEPAVQFMYNIKLRFKVKEPEPKPASKPQREYIWLTPEGDLKVLKLEDIKDNPKPRTTPTPTPTTPID